MGTEITTLVVHMAKQNRGWGYVRIQGVLANLGYTVARNTVANILKRHGVEPAPERIKRTTWKEFLKQHWNQIVATDFFSVEVWDSFRADAIHRALVHGYFDSAGADWRDCEQTEWIVDGANRPQSDGCRGWFLHG